MKLEKLLFSFLLSFLVFANLSQAANINWTGAGDGTSWTDGNNWQGGSMPGTADRAVFPAGIGSLTVVQGPGTPSTITGIWVFNNTNLTLNLDLNVSGASEPVRVFTNNTLTFGAGFTFNLTSTGLGPIVFWNNNSTINVAAGATLNISGPWGIRTRGAGALVSTFNNFGTINLSPTSPNAIRPSTPTQFTFINHPCATINMLTAGKINMWGAAGSTLTNNGLITYLGGTPPVSVIPGNTAINNAFYSSGNPGANFGSGAGTVVNNGINIANPATLTLDAGGTCGVANLGFTAPYTLFDPLTTSFGNAATSANGSIEFNPGSIIGNPGTVTLNTCHPTITFTVSNVAGDCLIDPASVPTLSEWGLFILGLIMLIIGTLALAFESRLTMVTSTGQNVNMGSIFSNLPFQKNYFFKAFLAVFMIFAIVFTTAIAVWGYEMTASDPFGTVIASGLIAYWVMLFKAEKKG